MDATDAETGGDWRPAVFTRRRHYVRADSPTRPYQQLTLGSGLCGCPGYLDDRVRGRDWREWKLCQYCLPLWLTPWPPPGYRPSGYLAVDIPEIAPLRDWWWCHLGNGGPFPLQGFRLHAGGIDSLRCESPEAGTLQLLDPAGWPRHRRDGPLPALIALLGSDGQR